MKVTADDFSQYLFVLFVLTGWLMLQFDVKTYAMADMDRERKASRVLGWINLVIGLAVFMGGNLFELLWWWD